MRNWYAKNRKTVLLQKTNWRKINRIKANEDSEKWRTINPEKVKESQRRWYEKNSHLTKTRANEWRKNNPEKNNAKSAYARASKTLATPIWANEFFISEIYHLAKLRTKATGFKWHVDHIIPLRSKLVCGLHVEHNLQVIPAIDNYRKSNSCWPDMP